MTRRALLPALAISVALSIVACGGGGNPDATPETTGESSPAETGEPIKVGSKDFTEQFILGEMYALVLEEAGLPVERKLNLGGTPVAQAGLESGEIDVYPEYTGTGLVTVLKLPVSSDQAAVFQAVSDGYKQQYNLVWLDPAPMNNTQALAMTKDVAAEYGVQTLSDLAANASELVMIGPPEFEARGDGLPGIKEAYGDFQLQEYKAVDPGLRYTGLVEGEADVAVAFGTDGEISAYDLVVLEDDKNLFPPYQVAPVIRQETLEAYPDAADALNELSPLLTDETMQRLNNEVSGNQREPADVAREFLETEGLL